MSPVLVLQDDLLRNRADGGMHGTCRLCVREAESSGKTERGYPTRSGIRTEQSSPPTLLATKNQFSKDREHLNDRI